MTRQRLEWQIMKVSISYSRCKIFFDRFECTERCITAKEQDHPIPEEPDPIPLELPVTLLRQCHYNFTFTYLSSKTRGTLVNLMISGDTQKVFVEYSPCWWSSVNKGATNSLSTLSFSRLTSMFSRFDIENKCYSGYNVWNHPSLLHS
jgi:hypothetical protein